MRRHVENAHAKSAQSARPAVPVPVPLMVACAAPDAVSSTKTGERLQVLQAIVHKPVDEVACNRNQVGVESVDAPYDALKASYAISIRLTSGGRTPS